MKKSLLNIVLLIFSFLGLLNAQNEITSIMYVNTPLLNLRSEPNLNARILEQLKNKDVVEFQYETIYTERINERDGTWVKIKTNHNEGFVFDYYLDYPIKVFGSIKEITNVADKYCYSVSKNKPQSLNRIYDNSSSNIEQINFPFVVFSSNKPIVENKTYHYLTTKGLIKDGSVVKISKVLDSLNNEISYSLDLLSANRYTALYLDRTTSFILDENNKNVNSRIQIKLSQTILNSESVELVWHGDINGDNYPELIINVASEVLSTQYFVVSSGMKKSVLYSEWNKKEIGFKECF